MLQARLFSSYHFCFNFLARRLFFGNCNSKKYCTSGPSRFPEPVTDQSSFNLFIIGLCTYVICILLTLKEFCESFYQTMQDLIMIITNFIHLFVAVLWASFFPSVFDAIFQPVVCAASSG